MRSESKLKLAEHKTIEQQIAEFFAKGKTIEQLPINAYKHEAVTQRDKAAIMQVGTKAIREMSK